MSNPYIGEIKLVAFNFAPVGWAFCNGSIIAIDQDTALFSLIGTTFGGDGVQTFALPDLRSRVAIGQGQGLGLSPYVMGQEAGAESVNLTVAQIPSHTHALVAAADGNAGTPSPSTVLGTPLAVDSVYVASNSPNASLSANSIAQAGGNQRHENRQPFLAASYIISLFGIFPSRS